MFFLYTKLNKKFGVFGASYETRFFEFPGGGGPGARYLSPRLPWPPPPTLVMTMVNDDDGDDDGDDDDANAGDDAGDAVGADILIAPSENTHF